MIVCVLSAVVRGDDESDRKQYVEQIDNLLDGMADDLSRVVGDSSVLAESKEKTEPKEKKKLEDYRVWCEVIRTEHADVPAKWYFYRADLNPQLKSPPFTGGALIAGDESSIRVPMRRNRQDGCGPRRQLRQAAKPATPLVVLNGTKR